MYTSLNVKMKDQTDKELAKSITYINASASSADLKSMAQGLVGLTTNTYQSADRIQKLNVDTEQIPQTEPARLTPAFTFTKNTVSHPANASIIFSYNGNGTITASATGQDPFEDDTIIYAGLKFDSSGNYSIYAGCIMDLAQPLSSVGSYQMTITASQTDEYKELSTVVSASAL